MMELIVLVALTALLATSAQAFVTRTPAGHRISLMQRPGKRSVSSSPPATKGVLVSHGGAVLGSEAPYLVFWTPPGHPVAPGSQALMSQYLTDTARDSAAHSTTNVYSVLGQYGSPYNQSFRAAQAVRDVDPYPANQNGSARATG